MTKQLLHMVLGGKLKSLDSNEFADLDQVDVVGLYANYEAAKKIWRSKAQATVDDAMTKYFVIHVHRLLDPDDE